MDLLERSLESSFRVVKLAKLEPESLMPRSQALKFANETVQEDQTLLLEVTPEVADELEKGQNFVFRGDPEDWVALCSNEKVYEIKEAETSNSLLVVKAIKEGQECHNKENEENAHGVTVLKTFYRYLEIKPAKPGWQKLFEMLESRQLKRYQDDHAAFSWPLSELLDRVQCSESELLQGLRVADAIELDNDKWTTIDPDMRMRIVSLICNVVSENSWSWNKVPKDEAVELIKDIEAKVIVEQVFDQYFDSCGGVKRDKLCRFFGQYLLQSSSVFNEKEFMSIWQESLPIVDNEDEGFKVDIGQLEGLALVDKNQIRYFPESKLPLNVQERLSLLFETKPKWTVAEITPFVQNLTTGKLNVKALLTKYARASNVNGQQFFSSKHRN